MILTSRIFISSKLEKRILEKFKAMKIHKRRKPLEELAEEIRPVFRGIINYYSKFSKGHLRYIFNRLNTRLIKRAKWEKGLYNRKAVKWLKKKYEENSEIFHHYALIHSY